jgi:hypothetical protein
MTELYRGLLLVLTTKFYELILSFRTHVQQFKKETTDPTNYFDVDVLGFWNLMLEIVLTIFSLTCLVFGVSLIALLAVVFYPCHAFLRYTALILKNIKNPAEPNVKEKVIDESPVIIKKNDKEKE